jgi:hypothetical protein
MERQGRQSRPRACSARTVSTVSKPFKKPRQAKERPSSLDTDSEGPTQLPPQSDNEGPPDLNPKTTDNNTEYVPSPASLRTVSETDDEEDSVPISKTLRPIRNIVPYIRGIKLMSEREANDCARNGEVLRWSSDSEGDEVPLAKTVQEQNRDSNVWVPTTDTEALLAAA